MIWSGSSETCTSTRTLPMRATTTIRTITTRARAGSRRTGGVVKTIDYLFGYGDLYWPALVAGVAMAVLAGALSVFVVSRRLAFVGQGVSHTAFGGVGLASVLGLTESGLLTPGGYALVGVFCVASALVIGFGAGREGAPGGHAHRRGARRVDGAGHDPDESRLHGASGRRACRASRACSSVRSWGSVVRTRSCRGPCAL